jgi:hypothetical protein
VASGDFGSDWHFFPVGSSATLLAAMRKKELQMVFNTFSRIKRALT